jgi:hypothetical protein
MAATATVTIDSREYTYGCPDWPCPVLPIVAEHIAIGYYFWLPAGTFAKPAIYLIALRTPVQLRLAPPPPIIIEPPAPYLTGPEKMLGAYAPPRNQLVCENVALQLNVPDKGPWDFVSASLRLVDMERTVLGLSRFGSPTTESLTNVNFIDLLEGTYDVRSSYGNIPAYEATFTANLSRRMGDRMYEATVEHTLLCATPDPPEPEPEAPYLTGPERVRGTRYPDRGLVCRNFDIDLVSPDEGPWAYKEGELTVEYLRWGSDLAIWIPTGFTSEWYMEARSWDAMLDDAYEIWPEDRKAVAYRVTIEGSVFRTGIDREWVFPVEHSFLCLGPDFYDMYDFAKRVIR